MPDGLLSGLRVVELGGGISASLVGLLLAEQGAEVVRLVDPAHPPADPVLDALLCRAKTEAAIAYDAPDAAETMMRLAARADVVVVGMDPTSGAVLPALDLDAVRATGNPGLVSAQVTAFPPNDPRQDLPPYEAIAGMAGFLFNKPIGKPCFHDFAIPAVTSALYVAIGIVAALIARERVGQGQEVSASYYEAALNAQVIQILAKAGLPRGFLPLRMVGSPFMRVWECGDGRFVYLHITMPKHNAAMLRILEQSGHADHVARIRAVMSEQTERDPSQVGSIAEANELKAIYAAIFRSKSAGEWEELLGNDLCCIQVRTIEEWLHDSMAAGMTDATRIDDPVYGDMVVPGPLVAAPEHPPITLPRRAKRLDAVLDDWEGRPLFRPAPTHDPADLRHPLEGIRVVDLSRIIAGPTAARVLAELGADVVSIQSETRLDWALSFHLIFNAGKKSVTLDFTDEEGKQRLWALLDELQPDVLLHNYRHLELAGEIGVGPDQVRARYPGVTYTHLNAYGNHGTWKDRPGFEQVVQAVSGIQVAYARGSRPRLLPSPIIDVGCGLLGAFGTLLGLYRRRKTGRGALVTTHLTNVAVLLQLPSVAAFQREACLERARALGAVVTYRPEAEVTAGILSALGRPVCVAGPRRDLCRWLEHLGVACGPDHDALAAAARRMFWRPVRDWRRSLEEAGVGERVALMPQPKIGRIAEQIRDYDARPAPAVERRLFPGSRQELAFVRNPLRLSLTPLCDVDPPPVRGSDTTDLLGRIGVDLPHGAGVVPYPPDKPLLSWLLGLARWGYFAWKSGNI